jgi:archaellum biogenesis ATPase FlaH
VREREAQRDLYAPGSADTDGLRRLDVAYMTRSTPPPVPWVVEGLVVRGMLTLLHGAPGRGKSLLTMALAAGVATGQAEAGMRCNAGTVVIVDAENGPYEIHRRVRTLELPIAVHVYEVNRARFNLRNGLDQLDRVLAECKPSLLVLDSFRSLWGGKENESDDVAPVLDQLRNLVRKHQAGTVLLHHSSRNGGWARGSTAIEASCELVFKLAREDEDPDRDQRRYLECGKCRPAPEPAVRWLRLSADDRHGCVYVDETDPFESEDRPRRTPSAPVRAKLREQILVALLAGRLSTTAIESAIGVASPNRSTRRVLDSLVDEGLAKKLERGAGKSTDWDLTQEGGKEAAALKDPRQPANPAENAGLEPNPGVGRGVPTPGGAANLADALVDGDPEALRELLPPGAALESNGASGGAT